MLSGLREEKRLWEQELVQQGDHVACGHDSCPKLLGASLAQDRGRMEAKVEGMEQEVTELRVKNQQLCDSLRVKEKVCDDRNDAILQLKQV